MVELPTELTPLLDYVLSMNWRSYPTFAVFLLVSAVWIGKNVSPVIRDIWSLFAWIVAQGYKQPFLDREKRARERAMLENEAARTERLEPLYPIIRDQRDERREGRGPRSRK